MKDYQLYSDIRSVLYKINLLLDNYEVIPDCNLEEPLVGNYCLVKELDLEHCLTEKLYERAVVFEKLCEKLYKSFK